MDFGAGCARRALFFALASVLAACEPELGECDAEAAIAVAYDRATGMPAYEGQALLVSSCGYGAFCHGADATDRERFGVPRGLELDVRIAAEDGSVDEAAIARLRHGRFRAVQEARAILHTLDLGTMPPDGELSRMVASGAPVYVHASDAGLEPLPSVDTPGGREIVRNWLACGAPVVERPAPREDGAHAVVVPALVLPPVEPTWDSIFRDVLAARGCAGALCHGGTEAGFRVTDPASTYDALVGRAASGKDCEGMGTLVVPGDPDASLFLQKLSARADEQVCGRPMPIGGLPLRDEDLAAVRSWIEAGAPP